MSYIRPALTLVLYLLPLHFRKHFSSASLADAFLALLSGGCSPAVHRLSLTLTDRRPALGTGSSLLASLVKQRVAGRVQIFDFHLVVIHTHGC